MFVTNRSDIKSNSVIQKGIQSDEGDIFVEENRNHRIFDKSSKNTTNVKMLQLQLFNNKIPIFSLEREGKYKLFIVIVSCPPIET
jgi:hypothetical protein